MIVTSSSQTEEIARLKLLLATATERLEQVQAAVFDLRCSTARKEGRGLWIREKDRSGLKAAIWGEKEDLGAWIMTKADDVPAPDLSPFITPAREFYSELGIASSSSSSTFFSKYLPPELLHQIVENTDDSTNHSLCLVSSLVRAIASPQLYKSMIISDPAQLNLFLPNPLARYGFGPFTHADPSLTLDNVVSLELTVRWGLLNRGETTKLVPYRSPCLPSLRHISILFKEDDSDIDDDDEDSQDSEASDDENPDSRDHFTPNLSLAANFLSHLNPHSLTIQFVHGSHDLWASQQIPSYYWLSATQAWTRLKSITFVDCEGLLLYGMCRRDHRTYGRLSEMDLPGLEHLSLSWRVTERLGGYAGLSSDRKKAGDHMPLLIMGDVAYAFHEHGPPADSSIHVDVGAEQVDRDVMEEDMKELPEAWKRLFRA